MAVADPVGTLGATLRYRIAIACGLVPMVLGTVIFVAWLFTDLDALEIIGVLFIYGGVLLFAVGIGSLSAFVSRARKAGSTYRKPTALALAILVLNLPLCAAYISIAFALESAHVVAVVNRAGMPIEGLTLTDPAGQKFRVGTVRDRGGSVMSAHSQKRALGSLLAFPIFSEAELAAPSALCRDADLRDVTD